MKLDAIVNASKNPRRTVAWLGFWLHLRIVADMRPLMSQEHRGALQKLPRACACHKYDTILGSGGQVQGRVHALATVLCAIRPFSTSPLRFWYQLQGHILCMARLWQYWECSRLQHACDTAAHQQSSGVDGAAESNRLVSQSSHTQVWHQAVIEACVKSSTHYIDLCGELSWMQPV